MKQLPKLLLLMVMLMAILPGAGYCIGNASPDSAVVELRAGDTQTFSV